MTTKKTTAQTEPEVVNDAIDIFWQDHLSPTYNLHEHAEAAGEEMRGWMEQQAMDDRFERRCGEARTAIMDHHTPTTFQEMADALASDSYVLQFLAATDKSQRLSERLTDWVRKEIGDAVDTMIQNWAEAMDEMEAFEAKYPQRWS